ncbi:MAG: ribosomal protein S18-alanine N-acetyltransferase [Planctomycetia bacterium]|nr:ribosomal protein S18-alanine N-acetyltransferase [Planctomycetia bacterium]
MQLTLAYESVRKEQTRSDLEKVGFRWMVRSDLEEVLTLERRCFEYRWTKEDFAECLSRRNCAGMVALYEGRIVGFMVYEVGKRRIELISLAIAPEEQRRGTGRALVMRLIRKLRANRRTKISVTVRERNLQAQLFFRELGFRASSIMRQFYEPAAEDAYVMQFRLNRNGASAQDSTGLFRPVTLS